MNENSTKSKLKVVISGAGSGIGFELAKQYHERQAELVLIDLYENGLKKLEKRIGSDHRYYPGVDVGDYDSLTQLQDFEADVVIACAGIGALNPAQNFSLELNRQAMAVNYFGNVNLFQVFLPRMIKQEKGSLVGVSSLAALRGMPQAASYSASKAAQMNYLESIRLDLKPRGVHVLSVHPGFVKTPMADHNQFLMPFTVSPVEAARKIITAIDRKSTTLYFPVPMALLAKIQRILPQSLFEWLIPRLKGGPKSDRPVMLSALKSIDDKSKTKE